MNLFPASKTIETGLKPERKQSFKKMYYIICCLMFQEKESFQVLH